MYNILIFGDSIAAGRGVDKAKSWASLLVQYLDKKDKRSILLYNLSIPGQSTNEVLKRFSAEAEVRCKKIHPDDRFTIIFAVGINDTKCVETKDNVVTTTKNFKNNIRLLINNAHKYTSNIMFVGPTLVDEKKTTPIDTNYFFNKKILEYSSVLKKLCIENGISFIDIADNWCQRDYKKFLTRDGIHLNEQSHKAIYENIIKIESFNFESANTLKPFQILQKEYSLSAKDIKAIKSRFIENEIIQHDFFFGQFNDEKPDLIIGAPCIRKDIEGFCLNTFSQIFAPIKIASILNLPCKLFIGVKEEMIFQPKSAHLYQKLGSLLEKASRNIAKEFGVEIETVNTACLGYDNIINECIKDLNVHLSDEDSTYLFNLSLSRPKKQLHSPLRILSSKRVVACNTSYALNKLFGPHRNLIVADMEQYACALFARKFEKKYKSPNFLAFLPLPNIYGTASMFKSEKEERLLLQKDNNYYKSIFERAPSWVLDSYRKLFELVTNKEKFPNKKKDVKSFITIAKHISNYFPKLNDQSNSKN